MTTRWKITLISQQRVSFGTGNAKAFLTRSHPFVPGAVVRGALAAAWLREGYPQDESFRQIFEAGRFSNALPEGVTIQPQSVARKKYGKNTAEDDRDQAFDGNQLLTEGEELLKGDCDFSPLFGNEHQRVVTATALEPGLYVAKESSLFSRQALEKGTVFTGTLVLPDGCGLGCLKKIQTVYVGGRSSVMGRTELWIDKEEWAPLPHGEELVIRTTSQSILVDEFGAPQSDFAAELEKYGIETIDGQIWAQRIASDVARGWHAASGLPKPMEMGFAAGATARIKRPTDDSLMRLLRDGIGLRRSEGYGWVEIVEKAYERPTDPVIVEQPQPAKKHTEQTDNEKKAVRIMGAKFTNDQKQWLANMLRQTGKDHVLTDPELGQPVVRRLSRRQTQIAKDVIKDTPQNERGSLAHAITRGAAQ